MNVFLLFWVFIGAFIGVPAAVFALWGTEFGQVPWWAVIYLVIYVGSLALIFGNKSFSNFLKEP